MRLFLLVLFLSTLGPAAAETPYWQWSPQQAESYESLARTQLKANPDSPEALDRLAKAIVVLSYNNPNTDDLDELLKVLKRSYSLAPTQTTAVLLARYCEDPTESAKWAVKALSYSPPSVRALDYFENLVKSDPRLAKLENEDVRRARRRLQRWRELLASYGSIKQDMVKTYSQEDQDRRLPPSPERLQVKEKTLEARSKSGKLFWTQTLSRQPTKLVSFMTALVVIDPDHIRILDPGSGKVRHTLPGVLKTALKDGAQSVAWKASESPGLLLGADEQRLYVAVSHWFCVFRAKDGSGWARYFSHTIRAVPCPDNKVLVVQTHHNQLVAHRLSDGKELWTFDPPPNQVIDVRKVTNTEVVVYLPGLERIVILDRDRGDRIERLSYETLHLP